eukprot:2734080-Rhodomonas_salina.1
MAHRAGQAVVTIIRVIMNSKLFIVVGVGGSRAGEHSSSFKAEARRSWAGESMQCDGVCQPG